MQSFAVAENRGGFVNVEELEKVAAEKEVVEKEKTEQESREKDSPEKNKGDAVAKATPNTSSVSGEVFAIRNMGQTEVFLRKNNEKFVIPKGVKHNSLMKELQKSEKSNKMVTIEVDLKTKEIRSVKEFVQTPASVAQPTSGTDSSTNKKDSGK